MGELVMAVDHIDADVPDLVVKVCMLRVCVKERGGGGVGL